MRAPLWHLHNNFWRWWYAGPRWMRWTIIMVGLALGVVLAAGWPDYRGLLAG
jgi:hypothetical protein